MRAVGLLFPMTPKQFDAREAHLRPLFTHFCFSCYNRSTVYDSEDMSLYIFVIELQKRELTHVKRTASWQKGKAKKTTLPLVNVK